MSNLRLTTRGRIWVVRRFMGMPRMRLLGLRLNRKIKITPRLSALGRRTESRQAYKEMNMEQLTFSNGDLLTRDTVAIDRIKSFEPKEGYYLAFSGGKDSILCYDLLKRAGVRFESHYNLTTVDPPELVRFIRKKYPDVEIHYPELTMWQLMRKRGFPPTRRVRYCCQVLKEGGGEGRFIVTGVRWAESSRRKSSRKPVEFDSYGSQAKGAIEKRKIFLNSDNDEKRRMIETCTIKGKHILNPIIDWDDDEVWGYIHSRHIPYPELYDNGWDRIGCIGCPLTSEKKRSWEFEQYPKIKNAFVRVFNDLVSAGHDKNEYLRYANGSEMFEDWVKTGMTIKQMEE